MVVDFLYWNNGAEIVQSTQFSGFLKVFGIMEHKNLVLWVNTSLAECSFTF